MPDFPEFHSRKNHGSILWREEGHLVLLIVQSYERPYLVKPDQALSRYPDELRRIEPTLKFLEGYVHKTSPAVVKIDFCGFLFDFKQTDMGNIRREIFIKPFHENMLKPCSRTFRNSGNQRFYHRHYRKNRKSSQFIQGGAKSIRSHRFQNIGEAVIFERPYSVFIMRCNENDGYVRFHLIENCKAQPVRKDYVGNIRSGQKSGFSNSLTAEATESAVAVTSDSGATSAKSCLRSIESRSSSSIINIFMPQEGIQHSSSVR